MKIHQSISEEVLASVQSKDDETCKILWNRGFTIVGDDDVGGGGNTVDDGESDGDMDIAFTLVVHRDIHQISRLLRMIYRRNNYYCIHTDARSTAAFVSALNGLATCFGANVELVPSGKRVALKWGDASVLRPQLICGEQALRRHSTWKYLINIVGQDFPLKTNLEIIAALKALNGSNLVEAEFANRTHYDRGQSLPLNVSLMITWLFVRLHGIKAASTEHLEGNFCKKPFTVLQLLLFASLFFSRENFSIQMNYSSIHWPTMRISVCQAPASWHLHLGQNLAWDF